MKTSLRTVAVVAGLASLALLGACGSKPSATATSAPVPPATLTAKSQATAYCKALVPVYRSEYALYVKVKRFQSVVVTSNAFSYAARIDDSYLPLSERAQARLAAIKPPATFLVAHRRLEKVFAVQSSLLYYLQDQLRRATFTGAVDLAAFKASCDRYVAQTKAACHAWEVALRAALERSGVKETPRPLRQMLA
jgi:hypothetical protein